MRDRAFMAPEIENKVSYISSIANCGLYHILLSYYMDFKGYMRIP